MICNKELHDYIICESCALSLGLGRVYSVYIVHVQSCSDNDDVLQVTVNRGDGDVPLFNATSIPLTQQIPISDCGGNYIE